jgi:AcrR family transcriptional regulator
MGRKSKAEIRKTEILTEFYQVIKEDGFEHASIAKIAGKIKINPSLIIHYFNSKDEMIIELVDFFLNKFEAIYLEKFKNISDPNLRFETAINFILGEEWIDLSQDHHSVFYACHYLSTRNSTILLRFQKMYQHFKKILTEEANIWIENKIIKSRNPEEIAEYLIILNEGLTFYEGIKQNKEELTKRSKMIKELAISALKI